MCYNHVPVADKLVLEYLDNSNVMIFNVIYDEYQPYSCSVWANYGNEDLPIMISDGSSIEFGGQNTIERLFFNDTQMPKHVFIDHDLNVYYKQAGSMSNNEVSNIIDEMLDLMGQD